MSDSLRLSHRAVAASAAFLLTGFAFGAPAFAEGGKGGKKGDRSPASHGAKGDAGAKGGSAGAQGGNGDPAGNNGTFKVDGLPYSDGMANEPHVACGFRLRFFGFDDDQTGDITIRGHAPSGSGTVSALTGVTISDDAAGGGPNDVDAAFEYTEEDLALAGLTAHPQQGYHLKVTLDTDTPGGVKHKVFWFEPCATTPEVGGSDTETGDTETRTPPPDALIPPADVPTRVLGVKVTRTPATTSGPAVLGTRFQRPSGVLPFSGSAAGTLLVLGGGLVVLGGGAWAIGRRMRHVA